MEVLLVTLMFMTIARWRRFPRLLFDLRFWRGFFTVLLTEGNQTTASIIHCYQSFLNTHIRGK